MNQDDDAPASDEEQRDAAELAASLDWRARAPEELPPGLEAAVMDRIGPLLDARRADDRRRRVRLAALGGVAAAAAFALLLATRRPSEPPVAATAPPAPPADLLAVQARVARGGAAALAALDVEMRSYRRHYHDQLLRRRGEGDAMKRAALLALLALAGCSQPRRAIGDDWLADATHRHALADELLDRGDEPGARAQLAGVVDGLAPRHHIDDDDRRRVLQDTYYRLASLDLRGHDPSGALLHAERGLTLGGGQDLFVANLLVARGAAHEGRGEAAAAAADFHAALLINEQLLAHSLGDAGGTP